MIIQRRSFITGLVSMIAAPAIVRIDSLMPILPASKIVKVLWNRQIVITHSEINSEYYQWVKRASQLLINNIPDYYNDQANSPFKSS